MRTALRRGEVLRLRESGLSIERIAKEMHIGVGTVVRLIQANTVAGGAFQKVPRIDAIGVRDSKGLC
jgi:orotate phosphoribosyltransferase-like protein